MILAEKITQLRKKNGWSQEDLAEQLNVSRQSVSKWESAQSIPDLNKILLISQLFGVSTDYLLKDDAVEESSDQLPVEQQPSGAQARFDSTEAANRFLGAKEITAPRIAVTTSLCILSPVPLLFLGALAESGNWNNRPLWITENVAAGIGLIMLALICTAAVALYLSCRNYTAEFDYLDREPIDTAYGVSGMVQEMKARFRDTYSKNNMLATCLCILSTLPLFASIIVAEENELLMVGGVCLLLLIIAVAVNRFIEVGIIWGSYEKLLQEGEYSLSSKKRAKKSSGFGSVYWPLVTAIYLLISFTTMRWDRTWLVWVIAPLIQPLFCSLFHKFR